MISGRKSVCSKAMEVGVEAGVVKPMGEDQQLDPSKPSFMAMEIIKSLDLRVEILEAF